MTDNNIVLEAQGISKHFPGVLANDRVNFDLRKGEIHALLGENGAGKTTLMNVLYGLYLPESGEIRVDGKPAAVHSPKDSIGLGIGMVHQHFMLIPVFTVAENIMLGDEKAHQVGNQEHAKKIDQQVRKPTSNAFGALGLLGKSITESLEPLDQKGVAKRVRELSHDYGLDIDPNALVGNLPVGVQQRVEIVKALYRNAQILILDEPTAVLTPQEADELFVIMRELTKRGVSIIFITHKLKEVLAVADRITVMRAGKVVGTVLPMNTNEQQLASMMVGREVILTVEKGPAKPAEEILKVEDLKVCDIRGLEVIRGVSFNVNAGEILGIAGVQGNGQSELVEALTGLRGVEGGKMWFAGKDMTGELPRPITETGMAHIPEDRQRYGLVLSYTVADNLVLNSYYLAPFAKSGILQPKSVDANARSVDRGI